MSDSNFIPRPPRTPSPTTPIAPTYAHQWQHATSSHDSHAPTIHTQHDYDIQQGLNESPARPFEPTRSSSISSNTLAPSSWESGSMMYNHCGPQTASTESGFSLAYSDASLSRTQPNTTANPFNFTPVQYTAGATGGNMGKSSAMGKRRGHQYRHSSIHASAMDSIFKPLPTLRTPLTVPASLPMPTRKEAWWSMTRDQTLRSIWCLCHFLIAGYVQFHAGEASLAMTALSRLLLFDAAGATTCIAVDVMSNFEVWQRSSLKHPFGLERADVLAGFGMAVFIAFMGLDVISHALQHALENLGHHTAHSPHAHMHLHSRDVNVVAVLAIASTLISAAVLGNHARIGKAMRFQLIARAGSILGNPSHFLTLSCSVLLLALPFVPKGWAYTAYDRGMAFVVAGLMIALGIRLATALASMLLMSFRPEGGEDEVRRAVEEIGMEGGSGGLIRVEEARFWQVHYGLCMANLKLRWRGQKEGVEVDAVRIRRRVAEIVRRRFTGLKWDVSVQLALEKD